MNEKTVEDSMQIIMAAGDARLLCKKSLDAIADAEMEEAKKLLAEAEVKIAEAHHIQTDAIQSAVRGEAFEYNVLFAHAQDTLMTVYSEINIAKQMIKIFESWENRLKLTKK